MDHNLCLRNLKTENGIIHREIPPLWPQAHGEVQRQNRIQLKAVAIAQAAGPRFNLACISIFTFTKLKRKLCCLTKQKQLNQMIVSFR